MLSSVDDGLDDLARRLLGAMAESGGVAPRPFRKTTRFLRHVLGEMPVKERALLAHLKKLRESGDPELVAFADAVYRMRPLDEQMVAAGRAWRELHDPLARGYARIVELAQPFRTRVPLVEGNGNFGSEHGDPPADHMYTECRLSAWGAATLAGEAPNLLVNGARGHFFPHAPAEVLAALAARILGSASGAALAPDFPRGGVATRLAAETVTVRARMHFEDERGWLAVVVTEPPPDVDLVEPIEDVERARRQGHLAGIVDIRDESSRDGPRLVFVFAKGESAEASAEALAREARLERTLTVDGMALADGVPRHFTTEELLAETARRMQARHGGSPEALAAELRARGEECGGRRTSLAM